MATTSLLDIKEALIAALAKQLSDGKNPLKPAEGTTLKISGLLDKDSVKNLLPAMTPQMENVPSIEELAKSFDRVISAVDDWAIRAAVVIAGHRPNYGGGDIKLPHLSCDAPPLGSFESRLVEYLSAASKDPVAARADKAVVDAALRDFGKNLPREKKGLVDVIDALSKML